MSLQFPGTADSQSSQAKVAGEGRIDTAPDRRPHAIVIGEAISLGYGFTIRGVRKAAASHGEDGDDPKAFIVARLAVASRSVFQALPPPRGRAKTGSVPPERRRGRDGGGLSYSSHLPKTPRTRESRPTMSAELGNNPFS